MLEWAGISSSRGSSCPRDGSRVSWVSCTCTDRWGLYHWATWEAPSPNIIDWRHVHLYNKSLATGISFCKKKKNPLVNHVITWTLHSWKQGDFSWNTHQEARTGNEGVGAGITALTWCSFAGLKVTGGSRPSGLHASFRSTKTKETGLLYGSICVIELFFASVSKPESRGHKVEWRTMEDVF